MYVNEKPNFNSNPYFALSQYLKMKFNTKVGKISIDTNFGCAHNSKHGGCIFCNMESYRPSNTNYDDIDRQIKEVESKSRYDKHYIYFQLGTPLSIFNESKTLSFANNLIENENCVGLQFGARSDMLSDYSLSYLNDLALSSGKEIWLEMGLQSSNDETLKFINRGHDYKNFVEMVSKIDKHYKNIYVCSHIVFGLPKNESEIESYDDMINTVKDISSLQVASVKFHHLQVVKGTVLEEIYIKNKFKTFTDDEYINFIVDVLSCTNESFVISRLIGDSIGDFLISPIWQKNKTTMLESIKKIMKTNGLVQGINLGSF